jgi:hypothetical protein
MFPPVRCENAIHKVDLPGGQVAGFEGMHALA